MKKVTSFPMRGEVWWIDLDPTKGSEIRKTRPCIIISRDGYNRGADTLTVIPITSGELRYQNWEVEIGESAGLKDVSRAVLPQIRVASKMRLKKKIGRISESQIREIQEKLLFYLGFDNLFGDNFVITGSFLPHDS
jgi:mRNA interferase MazF